jgi:hypothetical protein
MYYKTGRLASDFLPAVFRQLEQKEGYADEKNYPRAQGRQAFKKNFPEQAGDPVPHPQQVIFAIAAGNFDGKLAERSLTDSCQMVFHLSILLWWCFVNHYNRGGVSQSEPPLIIF